MRDRSRGNVGIQIEAEPLSDARLLTEDEPFRIALMGDFGGTVDRAPLRSRQPILLDRDNFDGVMRSIHPQVETPVGRVGVDTLEGFHPDSMYGRLPAFAPIRDTRGLLKDPRTSAEAVQRLTGAPAPAPAEPPADILGWVLSGGAAATPQPVRPGDELRFFIDEALRGATVAGADPQAAALMRKLDQLAARHMRAILHDPAFQAVEAAWRSAWMLTQRLETGADLKIYIVDVTREELTSDLAGVYEFLAGRGAPWALLAVHFAFGTTDIAVLRGLAQVAAKANAPVLAEADLSLLEGTPEWAGFRRTTEARWIGLAMPRVLLRLPYGTDTDPCDAFPFEEVEGKPERNQMLYGNPAPFCALLLAQGANRVDDLPVYTYEDDGEPESLPCAELALSEETAEALLDNGIMPVVAIRHRDSVQWLRFQSVADPATALPGRFRQ